MWSDYWQMQGCGGGGGRGREVGVGARASVSHNDDSGDEWEVVENDDGEESDGCTGDYENKKWPRANLSTKPRPLQLGHLEEV